MANASIRAEISLDQSQARAEGMRAGKSVSEGMSSTASMRGGLFSGAESGITKISSGINVMKGAAMAAKGTYDVLKSQFDAGKKFGDLRDALEQALPAGADLENEMSRIEAMMEKPGVDWETAIKLQTNLLSLGHDGEKAREIIEEVGNVLSLEGKDSPEALADIVGTLVKIDEKGAPAVKQIMALSESSNLFRNAFKQAFGTTNSTAIEELNLTAEEFLHSTLAGLKSLDRAGLDVDDKIANWVDRKFLDKDRWIRGGIDMLGQTDDNTAGDPTAAANSLARINAARVERVAALSEEITLQDSITDSKRKEQDIQQRIDDDTTGRKAGMREELKLQQAQTDSLQMQLKIKQRAVEEMMKSKNLTKEEAQAMLDQQIASARANDIAQQAQQDKAKARENEKTLAERRAQNEIAEAESKGHTNQTRKLKRAAEIEAKAKELRTLGMSPEDAKAMAQQEVKTQENQDYRERTGRNRIQGTRSPGAKGGIGSATFGGLDWLEKSKGNLRGEMDFPSLNKMQAPPKASPADMPMPAKDNTMTELAKAMTEQGKSFQEIIKLLEPVAKKYSASDLN